MTEHGGMCQFRPPELTGANVGDPQLSAVHICILLEHQQYWTPLIVRELLQSKPEQEEQ